MKIQMNDVELRAQRVIIFSCQCKNTAPRLCDQHSAIAAAIESALDQEGDSAQENQIYDEILKVFAEFGFATPEKTYRGNPSLLISDLRAILERQRNLLQMRNSEILTLEGILRTPEDEQMCIKCGERTQYHYEAKAKTYGLCAKCGWDAIQKLLGTESE